ALTRRLGGHDVHHHARRVHRQPARRVQTDPGHGHPTLRDGAAVDDPGGDVLTTLIGVHGARPGDRLLQRFPHHRVQGGQRALHLPGGHPHAVGTDRVETFGVVEYRVDTTFPHGVDNRPHLMQYRVHIH